VENKTNTSKRAKPGRKRLTQTQTHTQTDTQSHRYTLTLPDTPHKPQSKTNCHSLYICLTL